MSIPETMRLLPDGETRRCSFCGGMPSQVGAMVVSGPVVTCGGCAEKAVERLRGNAAAAIQVQPGTRWRWKAAKELTVAIVTERHEDGWVDLIFVTGPAACQIHKRDWTAQKIAEVAEPHAFDVAGHYQEMVAQWKRAGAAEERDRLLNTPEFRTFADAVVLEALHQRKRWCSEHDAGKTPADWHWLLGWLSGKAVHNPLAPGEDATEKRLHRIITVAAACANWHAQVLGESDMRPGIEPPKETEATP